MIPLVRCVVLATLCVPAATFAQECQGRQFATIGAKAILASTDGSAFFFESGLAIDADGAPDAYHPDDRGLDHLANAGKPGNWWGLVTEGSKPVVQGAADAKPGYYVSTTALVDPSQPARSPARYVDSARIPYVALPPGVMAGKVADGAKLGDFVVVIEKASGKVAYALVADVGPRDKIGEGSIALARELGIPSSPKKGGAASGVQYVVFPGSGNGRPRSSEEIRQHAKRLFTAFGGSAKLAHCR